MQEVKFEFYANVRDHALQNLKVLEHHAEYLLDLSSYPEIESVFGFRVTRTKEGVVSCSFEVGQFYRNIDTVTGEVNRYLCIARAEHTVTVQKMIFQDGSAIFGEKSVLDINKDSAENEFVLVNDSPKYPNQLSAVSKC